MSHLRRRYFQHQNPSWARPLALIILLSLVFTNSGADDIEVYVQPPAISVSPNVLFVLDESGSMQNPTEPDDPESKSRIEALKSALRTIVNKKLLDNVNTALLGYTTYDFSEDPPLDPETPHLRLIAHTGDFVVMSDEVRQTFLNKIDSLDHNAYTPTTDALEAAVDWFHPEKKPAKIKDGNSLSSPLESDNNKDAEKLICAPNRIILLSDGAPNTTRKENYGGESCAKINLFDNHDDGGTLPPPSYNKGARCANEIAAWAYNNDLSSTLDGNQNIQTYTLSFGTEPGDPTRKFMNRLARNGGGKSWHVLNEAELTEVFSEIILDAQGSIKYAMNAPSIPFNQDNTAVNGDYIYVPLFYPDAKDFWRGNLKKYKLDVSDDDIQLRAKNDQAVLRNDHTFNSTIDLFCNQGDCSPDGGEPLIGGVASQMTGPRSLFTNLEPSVSLDQASNRVHRDTTAITPEMLDVTTEEERTTLLDWITRDTAYIATETHPAYTGQMGAPIHTKPVVVHYSNDSTVYLPTSEGVLEAFDADTGEELWAFMPKDLLENIQDIRNNEASDKPYYGLDGPLTIYETNGHKMAIVGMRRGGEKYHMLDISDRQTPRYITEISKEASPTEFAKLGQTWSKPLFARMRINQNERDVLIFGGGYDPDQDKNNLPDDQGNAIYIVDAADGEYLLSISDTDATRTISGMNYSIPSNLATVDINGNDLVDRIYAADVGGRIIRVDFPDSETEENPTITGSILADINEQDEDSAHRKFFNAPQVGYYAKSNRQFLVLLIGTGDHAHPLNKTYKDRFYMIKDTNIWRSLTVTEAAAEQQGEFINATDMVLNDNGVMSDQYSGWYIELPEGEKSFSRAILYDFSIFFTTYHAERTPSKDPCVANSINGAGKIYGLNLIDADAAINWSGAEEEGLTIHERRSTTLELQGIPPSPMLVFPGAEDENGNPILGKKVLLFSDLVKKHELLDRFRPIYWEEVIKKN
jgi:type IV pilus assembly protein PilY1